MRATYSDRFGLARDQGPAGSLRCETRFGEDLGHRFDSIGLGHRGCGARVDGRRGLDVGRSRRVGYDGHIGRGACAGCRGLGRRRGRRCFFGWAGYSVRKLVGRHSCCRILVVGRCGRSCDRHGRGRGTDRRWRRFGDRGRRRRSGSRRRLAWCDTRRRLFRRGGGRRLWRRRRRCCLGGRQRQLRDGRGYAEVRRDRHRDGRLFGGWCGPRRRFGNHGH